MLSASDESEDDFFDNAIRLLRRPRIFRNRINLFEEYNDTEFKLRFRLGKDCVLLLLDHIGNNLLSVSYRNKPILPMMQLLIALRFYATGTFQNMIGDGIQVSKASVSRIVKRVSHEIALLKPAFIKMPDRQNLGDTKRTFYEIAQCPNVIGAIDCTHIRLQSPGSQNAELFRNRKGYFSINVQAVCDGNLQFLSVIARWPGSVHDSTIFLDSPLRHELAAGIYPNSYLLGDNGYACKNYLLTPVLNPNTPNENEYNKRHILTRNTVECAFAVVKRRFPCLSIGLRLKMENNLSHASFYIILH